MALEGRGATPAASVDPPRTPTERFAAERLVGVRRDGPNLGGELGFPPRRVRGADLPGAPEQPPISKSRASGGNSGESRSRWAVIARNTAEAPVPPGTSHPPSDDRLEISRAWPDAVAEETTKDILDVQHHSGPGTAIAVPILSPAEKATSLADGDRTASRCFPCHGSVCRHTRPRDRERCDRSSQTVSNRTSPRNSNHILNP